MARTSRSGAPAANVDALDNIDLDDMFADEGDALFDGLDIDLDMDDIAGSGGQSNSGNFNSNSRSTAAAAPLQPPAVAQAPAAQATTRTRRKTKRKVKSPAFFEDDDEFFEEVRPPKKKKRASTKVTRSTAPQQKRGSTKKEQAQPQPKKGNAAKMPPPLGGGTSGGAAINVVAAAGQQIGGRQAKRGASFTTKNSLVRTSSETSVSSSKVKRSQSLTATSSAAASLAEIRSTHPGLMSQSNYCGLHPSSTVFYPFMPALPSEPSLKSRKVYPFVDRIHVSFTSHLSSGATTDGAIPAKESDPIFQLVQEAHKEEKPAVGETDNNTENHHLSNRVEAVGNAIGTLRKTISEIEKPRLAGDWYAVCALLQRQHDFLLQNAENMERWCKENFSEADYASVYQPGEGITNGNAPDKQLSVLRSFDTPVLKVKVICTGLKEPIKPLIAILPPLFPPGTEPSKAAAKAKTKATKKRKATAEAKPAADELKPKQPPVLVSYVNMKPARRRKAVADLLSRTARELELTYLARSDIRQKLLDREEGDLQKMVQDDKIPAIHTTGMWQWLEKSGFFSNISEAGIRQFMNDVRLPSMARIALETGSDRQRTAIASGEQCSDDTNECLFDRLQSLLVEEEDSGDDATEADRDMADLDFDDTYIETESADLSKLTLDERSFIHLQKLGLAESLTPPMPKLPTVLQQDVFPHYQKKPDGAMTALIPKGTFASQHDVKPSPMDYVALPHPQKKPEHATLTQNGVANSAVSSQQNNEGDLESVIDSLKYDLIQADEINSRRAAFLESMVRGCHQTSEEVKRKNDQEAGLIAKCQQLLRKSKEMKAKADTVKKDNSLALPW